MADKTPILLTPEQRLWLTTIPDDLLEADLGRYYTLQPDDLTFIKRQHGSYNRLGIALQLCTLRYPGRPLTDMPTIPSQIVVYVAQQLDVSPTVLEGYGQRTSTLYEHLTRIREHYGYRTYGWFEMLHLARHLVPLAMENDQPFPLAEVALAYMRTRLIIAPGITTTERLIWRVQRIARRRVYGRLTASLTDQQGQALDNLLKAEKGGSGLSRLAWLRVPTGKPSTNSIYHLLERLAFIEDLGLPQLPPIVHPQRVRQLAQRCRHYQAHPLAKLEPASRRQAHLVAYLGQLPSELKDQLLDMFDRWLKDLMRRGRNAQKHHLYKNVTALNRTLNTLTQAMAALLTAKQQGFDPLEAMFDVVDEDVLVATVKVAEATMRPANMDYRDLLKHRYAQRRKALLQLYRTLSFEAVTERHPALEALDYVVMFQDQFKTRVLQVTQTVKKQTYQAPLDHLKWTRWKHHTLDGETINPNYYEMGAWQRLKEGLRAGDIAVTGSYRYQKFEEYLLDPEMWLQLKKTDQTRLTVTADAQTYLDESQQKIEERLISLAKVVEAGKDLTLDEDGLHLPRLPKSTPDEATPWRDKVYSYLPLMELADLLIEVDTWTNFLQAFTHLSLGQVPTGTQKKVLIASLMGSALNLANTQIAQATGFSAAQLALMDEWHIRPETLHQGLTFLDNFVLHQPFSKRWGRGTTSSSDGMRVPVSVSAANAVYNARYFGFRRGLTIVTHSADIWTPYNVTIAEENRESLHVIDALEHHQTDFDILEHHTDTGGSTYHVFALCLMLGFRFAPRLRSITKQYLFTVKPVTLDPSLQQLVKGQVEANLVREDWDHMRRLAASIRHSTVSASLIMRKLAAYPRQNQLAQAFTEVGKLERTLFVLQYLQDKALQNRTRRELNKGEAIHALGRTISSVGQSGEMHERKFDAQMNRASSLMVIVSAIVAWNTVYLTKVVSALQTVGEAVPEEYLSHISPLGWEHINFLGRYLFDLSQPYTLDKLRPLRKPVVKKSL